MFTLEIETDNEAFAGEDLGPEIARRLRELAANIGERARTDLAHMARRNHVFRLRDSNGNPIGTAKVSGIEDGEDE